MAAEDDFMATFVLDGIRRYSRWREDVDANDAVVVHPSGPWAFRSIGALRSAWPEWQFVDESAESHVVDFDAVRGWLAGEVFAIPHAAVLEGWNFAGDVARGVGLPWRDRGRLRDHVYDKLSASVLATPLGHPQWMPRWQAVERRALLEMGQTAIGVVRAAVQRQRE